MTNKLALGAGPSCEHLNKMGWTTVDIDPAKNPTYVATLPELPQEVLDQKWDVIEMTHVLEHLYLRDARILFELILDILTEDGVFITEQPDIMQCAQYLLGVKETHIPQSEPFFHMYGFYGDQEGPAAYQHLWGWHPKSLVAELRSIGFDRVESLPAQFHWPWRDFRVEARI